VTLRGNTALPGLLVGGVLRSQRQYFFISIRSRSFWRFFIVM